VFFLILCPAPGALYLISVWRNRGVWVLLYESGVLHWQRGKMTMIRWDEIESIRFSRVSAFADVVLERNQGGRVQSAWLSVSKVAIDCWELHLCRKDGVRVAISNYLENAEAFSQLIQERTAEILWPLILERLQGGDSCPFGALAVSPAGLTHTTSGLLPWQKIDWVFTGLGSVRIRQYWGFGPWCRVGIWSVPNPHLFLALVATWREWATKESHAL
jgi:hypothetical protein